jgi:hypothetical protein
MEHPVLTAIQRTSFTPLGWFAASEKDELPQRASFVILIGNAGPAMFRRFQRESGNDLDDWTRGIVSALATDLDAKPVFPFDRPPLPFLSWARRAGAGHISPLGLNIHPLYGLWHAFRAALLFSVVFDLPTQCAGAHPCESCPEKPCLSACPVGAFTGTTYDVPACTTHIGSPAGEICMQGGCLARRACPVGQGFAYRPEQAAFHMRAFLEARRSKEAVV